MAAKTYDTAQDAGTPAAGKYADHETKLEQLGACVNDHAALIDPLGTSLDGSQLANSADGAVSPATLQGSIGVNFPIAHADHATETLVYKTTRKIEIYGITVLKEGADAGGTVQLVDGADAAISDAIAAATDKARTSPTTLDPAKRTLAAGATFKLIFTRGAGSSKSEVIIHALPRA